jgi:hypothetical protein
LLQGHVSLSAEFELLRNLAPAPIPSAIDQGDADRGESARVFAAEWFTYRKRGRLAPYGIGTIDQALPAHREPLALIATGRIVAFEPQLDPVTESAREEVLDAIRGQLQSWLDFFSGPGSLNAPVAQAIARAHSPDDLEMPLGSSRS